MEPYEKFRESRQAVVKLEIALQEAFSADLPENARRDYHAYLRQRIRPAVEACVDRDNPELLDLLEAQGWLEGLPLEDFLRRAGENRKNAALVWLLRQKERQFGFSRPDFSL